MQQLQKSAKNAPLLLVWLSLVVASISAIACVDATRDNPPRQDAGTQPLKIGPPPDGGVYLGQYEWASGDVAAFQKAIGQRVALVLLGDPTKNWERGMGTMGFAFEASPNIDDNPMSDFTVDKLLRGEYDSYLAEFAEAFRQFGNPIFFETAREPNGVLADYMGGFGPDGNQSYQWALDNEAGFAEFDPSRFPNAELYANLGDPEVCDGLERLVAAQRYYYNYFVRQEGLDFLTFDTMGWSVDIPPAPAENESAHATRLRERCNSFEDFYPGDEYVDWVSINFYMDFPGSSTEDYLQALDDWMEEIRRVAPGRPVLVTESGFDAPDRVRDGLNALLSYPEIAGITMWSGDMLIRAGTPEGEAFRSVMEANPGRLRSCLYLTDGSEVPGCDPTNLSGLVYTNEWIIPSGLSCSIGEEHGVTCPSADQCSTGEVEFIEGCCIAGTCAAE